jgi:hypothetical protein
MKKYKMLQQRLADPKFLANLNANNEVAGYQSPTSGRITYNKIVDKKSFAAGFRSVAYRNASCTPPPDEEIR